ncbi:DUF6069 family protein [Actinoallomurus sp. NBC_01490]|nr:DUF6069 family protein [Actinoallomurus sp. NBC_01490]
MNDTGVVAGPALGQTSHTHRFRGLVGTGFVATLAAMVATTLAAALAQAVGVDFEVPDGGESVPLSGFAVVTGSSRSWASSLPSLFFVGALAPPRDSCGRQCR